MYSDSPKTLSVEQAGLELVCLPNAGLKGLCHHALCFEQ